MTPPMVKKTPVTNVRGPKPFDPVLEHKTADHRAALRSLEQELATQVENLNRSTAKEDSIEKDIVQLLVIKAKLEGVVATLDENVRNATAIETDLAARKIEAVLLKAYGHEIVLKLREVRAELYEARRLVEPEKTPDFLDDILNEDPKERQANRRRNYIRHMEIAEEIYSDILELIRKNKLEKKLFFGALTKEAYFGTYDASYSKLSRTESLSSHFFIRTELQASLGEEFTSTLSAPWFFKETDEYNSYRARAKSWTGKVAKLKELLQIEKPLSEVNEAIDLIPAAAATK